MRNSRRAPSGARLSDIAFRVGVSPSTVSRALRDLPGVSESVRREIAEAAAGVGGWSARGSAADTVVFCVPSAVSYGLKNPFFSELIRGVMSALPPDVSLVLADAASVFAGSTPKGGRSAVYIVASPDDVGLSDFLPGRTILIDTVSDRYPYITMDNEGAGRTLTQYLVTLGHRTVAFLGKRATHTSEMSFRGYVSALEASGNGVDRNVVLETAGFGFDDGAGGVRAVAGRATAIVAFNDLVAAGAIQGLVESGVRVPDDASVVSFDDTALASYTRPSLTAIHQPSFEEGRLAGALATRLLSGDQLSPDDSVVLPGSLVVRGSCSAPVGEIRVPARTT